MGSDCSAMQCSTWALNVFLSLSEFFCLHNDSIQSNLKACNNVHLSLVH